MKKLLGIAALALVLAAVSAPRASAWTNFHFGVGLDISYQAGNNNFMWGLFRNGPAGYETPLGPGCGAGACAGYPGYGYGPAAFAAPVYGGAPVVNGQAPNWVAPPPNPQPPAKDKKATDSDTVRTTVPAAYYQTTPAPYGYGAYTPSYYGTGYYPYSTGYSQAPSYWGW
jgi:hypothetical protein